MALTTPDSIPYVGSTERGDSADFPDADEEQALRVQELIVSLRAAAATAQAGAVPIAGILMWTGLVSQIPAGYMLCNGQPHNSSAALAKTGTALTPNLVNRFVTGAGPSYGATVALYNVGNNGGENYHTLTVAESGLRSHYHTGTTNSANRNASHGHGSGSYSGWMNQNSTHAHSATVKEGILSGDSNYWVDTADEQTPTNTRDNIVTVLSTNTNHQHYIYYADTNHEHYFSTSSSGNWNATSAHENRPSYYAVCFLMRVS